MEIGIIPEDVVVAGPGSTLDSLVGHQVEVALCRMVNALVNHGAGKGIAVLVLVVVGGEESGNQKLITSKNCIILFYLV